MNCRQTYFNHLKIIKVIENFSGTKQLNDHFPDPTIRINQ